MAEWQTWLSGEGVLVTPTVTPSIIAMKSMDLLEGYIDVSSYFSPI